jgi:hypothetical protein
MGKKVLTVFLRVGDLTWATKLYSGEKNTEFFFWEFQSCVFGIPEMETSMYLKHDIVQSVAAIIHACLFLQRSKINRSVAWVQSHITDSTV